MTAPGNMRDCCVFLEPKDSEFQGSRALCFPGAEAESKVMLAGLASGILAVTPGDNQPGCCDTGSRVSPGDAQAQCSPSLLGHVITGLTVLQPMPELSPLPIAQPWAGGTVRRTRLPCSLPSGAACPRRLWRAGQALGPPSPSCRAGTLSWGSSS